MRSIVPHFLSCLNPARNALRLPIACFLLLLISLLGVFALAVIVVKIEPFFRYREPSFDEAHPKVGEPAPDFTLTDMAAEPFHLAERFGQRPLVIEFGSFT